MADFEKDISVDKDIITIKIFCDKQVYSSQKRFIFDEDIWSLVPDEYQGKVNLIKSPDKRISNIPRNKYTNVGIWVFEIKKPEQPKNKSTRTRTRRTKAGISEGNKKN